MSAVGWVDSNCFDRHTNGPMHPERPERLTAVREGLARSGAEARLTRVEPTAIDRALLEAVHRPEYVAQIERVCASGGGYLDPDTSVVPESWQAALNAAGAVAGAVRRVISGDWQRAFCSVRPPGHHAPANRAMGFCLFDNVAVGAQAALNAGLSRVAIIDWDVHHGNGTQAIFWRRADVFYASWHQYPFYPGTGSESERGEGEGDGTTINCPLAAGAGDEAYLRAWTERIRPALDTFAPELLLISAGFDADARDPLAGLAVTAAGFETLSRQVVEWADRQCRGRIVSVLEGGYDLEALAEDVSLHVGTLL
jgi:acetoin utilization deacetylase AcuC-like enzyme